MATRPWTPADLGALDRMRWEVGDAASVTVAGGLASKILNKGSTGSAYDLVQAAAGSQPAYSGGVLTTNGSSSRIATSSAFAIPTVFANRQTGLIYGIFKYISGTLTVGWFTQEGRIDIDGAARIDFPDAPSLSGYSPPISGTSKIFLCYRTPTAVFMRINGTQVATAATTSKWSATSTDRFSLGDFAGGGYPANSEYRGAVGLADDYSIDTVQRIEGWLAWKMSDAGDGSYVAALPANHPYKAAGPTVDTGEVVIKRRRSTILIAS